MSRYNYIKMDTEKAEQLKVDFPNWNNTVTNPINSKRTIKNSKEESDEIIKIMTESIVFPKLNCVFPPDIVNFVCDEFPEFVGSSKDFTKYINKVFNTTYETKEVGYLIYNKLKLRKSERAYNATVKFFGKNYGKKKGSHNKKTLARMAEAAKYQTKLNLEVKEEAKPEPQPQQQLLTSAVQVVSTVIQTDEEPIQKPEQKKSLFRKILNAIGKVLSEA